MDVLAAIPSTVFETSGLLDLVSKILIWIMFYKIITFAIDRLQDYIKAKRYQANVDTEFRLINEMLDRVRNMPASEEKKNLLEEIELKIYELEKYMKQHSQGK